MKTHRIDLLPARSDRAKMVYAGRDLGLSRQSLFDAARKLLADGLAEPDDRIETWRGDTKCLSGPVWAAAKISVSETGFGPKFVRYESTEQIKQRFARTAIDR